MLPSLLSPLTTTTTPFLFFFFWSSFFPLLSFTNRYYKHLRRAIDDGLVDVESDLDPVVRRVLTHKFSAGLFDQSPVDPSVAMDILDNPQHRRLALEAAEQSIVLLKNEKFALPLPDLLVKGSKVSIALLGPTASSECACSDATTSLIGSYALAGANVSTLDQGLGLLPGVGDVKWAPGMSSAAGLTGTGINVTLRDAAVALARKSDVTVLVLGDVSGNHNGGCGEWGDRDSLDLQGGQLDLLDAVAGVAKKTIVVLVHGRPVTFGAGNQVLERVDALFSAFRPGEAFGAAMANLLSGETNPSGKLSQSWPRSVGEVGSGSTPWLQAVRGKWLANKQGSVDELDGRRYDDYVSSASGEDAGTPLFYFGHGMSYTNFSYESMEVREVGGGGGDDDVLWIVRVTVRNLTPVFGTEVVQVYVRDPSGLPFVPFWKRLIGYGRLSLSSGEVGYVDVAIKKDDVAMWHDSMTKGPTLTLFPGDYVVTAGGASNDATLFQTMTVLGE